MNEQAAKGTFELMKDRLGHISKKATVYYIFSFIGKDETLMTEVCDQFYTVRKATPENVEKDCQIKMEHAVQFARYLAEQRGWKLKQVCQRQQDRKPPIGNGGEILFYGPASGY